MLWRRHISYTMREVRFKFRCNILISSKIIKEMPGSLASGTPCINTTGNALSLYAATTINKPENKHILLCNSAFNQILNRQANHVVQGRVQLKRDGTRWRTGEKVKGKLANGVGSQYSSHYLRKMVYPALLPLMRTPRLPAVDWTDAPADTNVLVRFAERWNLVSVCVPSYFKRSLQQTSSLLWSQKPEEGYKN